MNNAKNMKKYLALLVVLLSALLLSGHAAAQEKMRLIVDTDAMAELDDQAAIGYALFSGNHFEVEGITVNRGSDGPHRTDLPGGSWRRSANAIDYHFAEAEDVVRVSNCWGRVPILKGPAGNYRSVKNSVNNSTFDGSDAVNFIIERAHAKDPGGRPLHIYACGNLTNVALALLKDPTIADKIVLWWMGTQYPQNHACNNHAGDLDAGDAVLANPHNVPFNIIPWPSGGVTRSQISDNLSGKGSQLSPAVSTRRGSFSCFGDFYVDLFFSQTGYLENPGRTNRTRTILDLAGFGPVKNNIGGYVPTEMGAPSFRYSSSTGSEYNKHPGTWIENSNNPQRVTMWTSPGDLGALYNDFFNTVDNYVLPGSTPPATPSNLSASSKSSYIVHHREHNLLLDATRSGNMDSFGVGTRGQGSAEQIVNHIVYDFKNQVFLDFRGTTSQVGKILFRKTDYYEYGVSKGADLGVVAENDAAYWMAEWDAPVSANFITLTGSYPDEPSQANTAWKIELRSNEQWRVHAQGVGGWYDRGQYFWGGRDQSPIQFDALRVKLYSKDGSTSVSSLHFRAQENRTWMVAFLPAIDARIAVTQQVPRAGQVVEFAGNQVFGTMQSWQWNFGDGSSTTGRTVSHTFANAGTYDVRLTLSGVGQTAEILERVNIHPAVEAQITPLPGSVFEGNPVTFDASNSYGDIGTYHWYFGDGSTATGRQVTKSFSQAGIYRVTLSVRNSTGRSNSCSALVRVHTPATVNVPQVLLDTDMETDDIYYVAYALYSELDILGINAVHHGGEDPGQEPGNYKRILNILDLANQSGLPAARQPRTFRGAAGPLTPPYSDNWSDTKPVVTEASEAILEAARGASPDNPVWVVPVGPLSNVANAILQVRREGWESEFHKRIRICWLGGSPSSARVGTWNGKRDPWAAYIVAQSGIEFLLMLEPVGVQLRWDKFDEVERYPDTPLGQYLYDIGGRRGGYFDPTALAAVISMHANKNWFWNLQTVTLRDRYQDYQWQTTTAPTNIRLIHNIDVDAIKNDFFNSLNGKPTALTPTKQKR